MLLCFSVVLPALASATTFDWPNGPSDPTWSTQPTSTTPATEDYFPSTGQGISVAVAITSGVTPGTYSGTPYPTVSSPGSALVNGNVNSNSLQLYTSAVNSTSDATTVTINFNYTGGAQNVTFAIYDVDAYDFGGSGFVGTISNMQATAVGGGMVYATVTTSAFNTLSSGTNGTSTAVVTGTGNAPNTGSGAESGTVTLDFGSTAVTSVSFQWSNSYSGTLAAHAIGVGPVTFTELGSAIPEVGSATGALALCGVLAGSARIRRRGRAHGASAT